MGPKRPWDQREDAIDCCPRLLSVSVVSRSPRVSLVSFYFLFFFFIGKTKERTSCKQVYWGHALVCNKITKSQNNKITGGGVCVISVIGMIATKATKRQIRTRFPNAVRSLVYLSACLLVCLSCLFGPSCLFCLLGNLENLGSLR